MATIKQIAGLAGVSRGTVDRVLNNRGSVNAETEQRIREIADSLNYSPNRAGKNLAIKKKNLRIGFIIFSADKVNPFFDDVVVGINKKASELAEYGVSVDILYSDFGDLEQQLNLIDRLVREDISGIAITPINSPRVAQKIGELHAAGIPTVTVNSDIENSPRIAYVGSNYFKSGRTAANLLELMSGGRANVGIITGSGDILCHSHRVAGFSQKLSEACPDIRIIDIAEAHDDDIKSYRATAEMIKAHPEIDSFFLAAAGVYGACRAISESGKQFKVISYDCVPSTEEFIKNGVITATICQQPDYQGQKPLDILFDYLSAGVPPKREFYYTGIEIKIRENL